MYDVFGIVPVRWACQTDILDGNHRIETNTTQGCRAVLFLGVFKKLRFLKIYRFFLQKSSKSLKISQNLKIFSDFHFKILTIFQKSEEIFK